MHILNNSINNVFSIVFMLLLCITFLGCQCKLDDVKEAATEVKWVDPYDMDLVPNNQPPIAFHDHATKADASVQTNSEATVYIKRFVRILMNNAHLQKHSSIYSGHLNLKISVDDFEFLQEFSNVGSSYMADDANILKVNEILERVFEKTYMSHMSHTFYDMILNAIQKCVNFETGVLLVLTAVLYVIYRSLRKGIELLNMCKIIFVILYLVDYFMTFMQLSHDIEMETLASMKKFGSTPPECKSDRMTWTQYLQQRLGLSDECREYYRHMFKNSRYLISSTPLQVFPIQFERLVLVPLQCIGNAIGTFAGSLYSTLPWPWRLAMFPFMLLFCVLILCSILMFTTSSRLTFSGLFFNFEYTNVKTNAKSKEKPLRYFIEDITPPRKTIRIKDGRGSRSNRVKAIKIRAASESS